MPRGGMVRLTPQRDGMSALTLILNGPPDRSGGVGGLVAVERELRSPAKYYGATPDDTMSLDCTIDVDAIGGPSVERRLRVLRDMGQPGDEDDLPEIKVDGDIWVEDQNITWAMTSWGLGERLFNSDGTLRRQQVKVDLERYTQLSEIKALDRRRSRKAGGKRKRRVTIAKGNDTLRGIALRELGDATRWKDIQRWNKKKLKGVDPDARLRTGTHLVIR